MPAAKVVPGDEVIWTIVANNVCATPAGDIAITNPVPSHMRYVGSSAFGPGANIEFSLDGSTFAVPEALVVAAADGSRRPARADEYSAIRWVAAAPDRSQRVVDRALSRHRSLGQRTAPTDRGHVN